MRSTLTALFALALASPAAATHCPRPGDIAPSPDGDGVVDVADVVIALRWAVGLDEPADEHEARAADVSPTADRSGWAFCDPCPPEAGGDWAVDVSDVVVILRAAVGYPLEWRAWTSRSVVSDLPEHLAIRWRIPDVPGECDGPIVTGWAERRIISEAVPCASTQVEPWVVGEEERGVYVTCEHWEPQSGDGALVAFWRSPTRPPWAGPYDHAPPSIEIRLPSGAWQLVSLR